MLRRLLFCNRPIRTFIIMVDIAAWTQNVDVDLCVQSIVQNKFQSQVKGLYKITQMLNQLYYDFR